ncbi:MAG: adenosylcobinamide-phosphate synthase CbiB [Thermodesulfobacteriota bacterium]
MGIPAAIALALLLDALLGDPAWLPHPVRLIGALAARAEGWCRRVLGDGRLAGVSCVGLVLFLTGAAGWALLRGAAWLHPWLGTLASILLLYTCFAARDLLAHSRRVHAALAAGDLQEARRRAGMMVGRDTGHLDRAEVVRATVESVAENSADGVVGPLFWAALAGPLGALLYKAASTLDSTFGYTSERYRHFGWAAARLDDLVNLLPARLTGLLLVLAAALLPGASGGHAWRIFWRDRYRHPSPNAGHPEAAAAGALGLQLGGTSWYSGQAKAKPFLGDPHQEASLHHILLANRLAALVTALAALLLVGLRLAVAG